MGKYDDMDMELEIGKEAGSIYPACLLAIDPGPEESAYVLISPSSLRPVEFDKVPNEVLERKMDSWFSQRAFSAVVIEMVGHYGTGMPAGADVFETCVEIGKLLMIAQSCFIHTYTMRRPYVKQRICGVPNAKDSNVIQALIDRFAPNTPNKGKGYKTEPGFFYGFKADVWQAFALGVAFHDWMNAPREERNKSRNMVVER